jgi:class 3 adenylate cyclase/tetratricopeptide (TPR) repeat protein
LSAKPQQPVQKQPASAVRFVEDFGPQPSDGERKTVTALFADIKGSMELMEDLDPEEARAIVDPALKLMIDAVHRYDGYIVQSTGDGIFALFGAPVAHEDHPQRALYAALRMQEELRRYSTKLREGGNLAVEARVGVNTGEVVVRSIRTGDAHTEHTPIGHSISLASRMQALAPTGSIATTEQTRKLCEGYFNFKPLGPTRIKGVSEPVNVVEVVGLGPLRTRLQVAERRGLTKFVGRQPELEQMRHALELARQGHGQIVAAMGEPGVGKSRLFFEFKAVAQSGCRVLEAYSVSHGKASAYLPVFDLLKGYFEITPGDDERKRREKVNGKIITLDRALEDTLPYLFGLLGIVEGDDDPLAQLDPQLKRRRTLEAIKRILVRESLNQPLIVEFEDLHWIDSETQALLNLLVESLATARILLLVNYRPEYHHQWGNKTYYSQLRLDPLGKESAAEMLSALLASPAPADLSAGANRERPTVRVSRSPERSEGEAEDRRVRANDSIESLKRLIIERTEGNPFFMEEMVQALLEHGVLVRKETVELAKSLDEIRVPPTVQAILASRIDRLRAHDKELLQTLAVLGREFALNLIRGVTGKPDVELDPMLSELQMGEFIYEHPAAGDVEYEFKHALTQEVAYNSLLSERRRLLHERAAQTIEALYSERLEDLVTELAHHYNRSGNLPKAVEYLGLAGQKAAAQVAHSEAVGYLSRALELLQKLPDSVDRARRELDLQMALNISLFVERGSGAPEREPVLLRARQLSEQLGDNTKLMEALLALATVHLTHREFPIAREVGRRALALAEQTNAPAMIGGACCQLGTIAWMAGALEEAREHCERAVELFGPPPFRSFAEFEYSTRASGILAAVLLQLGYPARAIRKMEDSLAAARRFSDPFQLAYALFMSFPVSFNLRDIRPERAEEFFSLTTNHGIRGYLFYATFMRGWTMAAAGRFDEGIAEMRKASAAAELARGTQYPPVPIGLAETYAKTGRAEEGLAWIEKGLSFAEHMGEKGIEPEFHRIKGDILLMHDPGNGSQAERCFRTAIDIACNHGARFWELRATTSLARLLKRQGRTEDARTMLADIYNWFTEGFDTADLKDAKALLEELGV